MLAAMKISQQASGDEVTALMSEVDRHGRTDF
jgi:hypothetical protein